MIKRENLTENPKLLAEWDYVKNEDLRPEDCANDPKRFVWWICAYGHSWQARISDRMKGSCCPYDCGMRMPGFTSLASVRPDLAAEWDHERNDHLSPQDISAYSQIKVKWRCNKGHRWQATVSSRHRGGGCLLCLKERLNDGQ